MSKNFTRTSRHKVLRLKFQIYIMTKDSSFVFLYVRMRLIFIGETDV